ncbi:MAG: hypothetical protein JSS27_21535 [Planctomycetes bacterium]|nr:hypothetical protein [Planctomycetota bacterium]
MGQPAKDPRHSANFGAPLAQRLKQLGVECEFNYPGAPDKAHEHVFVLCGSPQSEREVTHFCFLSVVSGLLSVAKGIQLAIAPREARQTTTDNGPRTTDLLLIKLEKSLSAGH